MKLRTLARASIFLGTAVLAFPHALAEPNSKSTFVDRLDAPAERVRSPATAPLLAAAKAGDRLVGVGMRGVIVVSDDEGRSWRQVASPVQSDLTALAFPTPTHGWAVGHDGIVLHTADKGETWIRQSDGLQQAKSFRDYYQKRIGAADEAQQRYADLISANFRSGPWLPYMGVWFEDALNGFIVGSFGMIAATNDGGRSWEPWLHRIDNPDAFNFNAITKVGSDVYIAGEHGMVYRLNRAKGRFTALPTGYTGSLFGIAGSQGALLAFGLRGTIYRSENQGAAWQRVESPLPVLLAGAAEARSGQLVLSGVAGSLISSSNGGRSFALSASQPSMLYTGVLAIKPGKLLRYGLNGSTVEEIKE